MAISKLTPRNGYINEHLQLGVPHKVVVKDSSPMILARPKSASFTERFLSASKMFYGLMSRWTIFLSCFGRSVHVHGCIGHETYKVFDPLE